MATWSAYNFWVKNNHLKEFLLTIKKNQSRSIFIKSLSPFQQKYTPPLSPHTTHCMHAPNDNNDDVEYWDAFGMPKKAFN